MPETLKTVTRTYSKSGKNYLKCCRSSYIGTKWITQVVAILKGQYHEIFYPFSRVKQLVQSLVTLKPTGAAQFKYIEKSLVMFSYFIILNLFTPFFRYTAQLDDDNKGGERNS